MDNITSYMGTYHLTNYEGKICFEKERINFIWGLCYGADIREEDIKQYIEHLSEDSDSKVYG